MRFLSLLCLCLMTGFGFAGSFDSYSWQVTFKAGSGEFQPILIIDYDYKADGPYDSAIALPGDSNYPLFTMKMKVDGQKVDPVKANMETYWSNGSPVAVLMPPEGGSKISVHAAFKIKNMFAIPGAPASFDIPCKKLDVSFGQIPGFQFGAFWVGSPIEFKPTRTAGNPGEPKQFIGFKAKNVKEEKSKHLLFIFPKIYKFSFNNLVGVGSVGGGNIDADTNVNQGNMAKGNVSGDNARTYSMVFYREDPARDWAYMPTWLQQDSIHLPWGIEPGSHVKSRSLFKGASDNRDDLIPWQHHLDDAWFADFPTDMDSDFEGVFKTVDTFREKFVAKLAVDHELHPMIVASEKDKYSPAMANLILTSELSKRLKVAAMPAFISDQPANLLGRLPAGAFARVVTAIKVKGEYYFIDAADPNWTLKNSFERLTGKNVVILDGGTPRVASFQQ